MMRGKEQIQPLNRIRKITAGLWLLALALFMPALCAQAAGYGLSNPVTDKSGVTTWDCVWFGNYYQSSDTKKEPIKWRVLSVSGSDAFLLADLDLDGVKYHETYDAYPTWEDCTLRTWLNKDFYNAAFSSQEKLAIRQVELATGSHPGYPYESYGGNNTQDKIFCLSWEDAINPVYGFPDHTGVSNARRTWATEYAKKKQIITSEEGRAWWWLRTPGYYNKCASFIGVDGAFSEKGIAVDSTYVAVRPALHINLSRSGWTKAQQVTSEDAEPTSKADEEEETQTEAPDPQKRDINKITPSNSVANSAAINTSLPTVNVDETALSFSADFEQRILNVKFKSSTRALNYRIAYRKGGTTKWSYAWTEGKNNYTFSKLKANQLLEFKITPFAKKSGVWKRGEWSKITRIWYTSTTASVSPIIKGFSIKVKKNRNATGYQILYSIDKKMKAALTGGVIKNLKSAQGGKVIKVRSLKKNTVYYVRWRPVRKYNGKVYRGLWNTAKKVTTK